MNESSFFLSVRLARVTQEAPCAAGQLETATCQRNGSMQQHQRLFLFTDWQRTWLLKFDVFLHHGQRGKHLQGDVHEEPVVEADQEKGNSEDLQSAGEDELGSALKNRYLQIMCQYFLARESTGRMWLTGTRERMGTSCKGPSMRYLNIITSLSGLLL